MKIKQEIFPNIRPLTTYNRLKAAARGSIVILLLSHSINKCFIFLDKKKSEKKNIFFNLKVNLISDIVYLLRLCVWSDLALCIWVNSEESLVVNLANTCSATDFLWLFCLWNLWCVRTDFACLCEGTVNFTHFLKVDQNRF